MDEQTNENDQKMPMKKLVLLVAIVLMCVLNYFCSFNQSSNFGF